MLTLVVQSVHDIESKYYADGEDAYAMRKSLKKENTFGDEEWNWMTHITKSHVYGVDDLSEMGKS